MISKELIENYNLKLADKGLALIQTDEGLSLSSGELSIMADFKDMLPRLKKSNLEREISTVEIGEMVMSRLKEVDEVAYVRFASVYRSFKDINTFMEELTKLLEGK